VLESTFKLMYVTAYHHFRYQNNTHRETLTDLTFLFQYILSCVECSLLKTFNTLQKYLMFVCYVRIHVAWSCSVQFCFANDFISRGPFSRGAIILSLKTVSGGYLYWLGPHYLFTISIFWLYILWKKWAWQIKTVALAKFALWFCLFIQFTDKSIRQFHRTQMHFSKQKQMCVLNHRFKVLDVLPF